MLYLHRCKHAAVQKGLAEKNEQTMEVKKVTPCG
jgi:hypothetical protein